MPRQQRWKGYAAIVDALLTSHDDDTQKGDARREAETIKEKMEELELVLMLEFWDNVLQRFKKTNATLQNQQISFSTFANSTALCLNTLTDLGSHSMTLKPKQWIV